MSETVQIKEEKCCETMKHESNIGQISGGIIRTFLNSTGQTVGVRLSIIEVHGISPVLLLEELLILKCVLLQKTMAPK